MKRISNFFFVVAIVLTVLWWLSQPDFRLQPGQELAPGLTDWRFVIALWLTGLGWLARHLALPKRLAGSRPLKAEYRTGSNGSIVSMRPIA